MVRRLLLETAPRSEYGPPELAHLQQGAGRPLVAGDEAPLWEAEIFSTSLTPLKIPQNQIYILSHNLLFLDSQYIYIKHIHMKREIPVFRVYICL